MQIFCFLWGSVFDMAANGMKSTTCPPGSKLRHIRSIPSLPSPGPWAGKVLATWKGAVIQKTVRFSWGLALGAYKPAKISRHKVNLSPDSLKTLIPIQIWHMLASKCSPSWPNLSQSWGHFVLQNAGFSWGLALRAHKPAKIPEHTVNFSPGSLIVRKPN